MTTRHWIANWKHGYSHTPELAAYNNAKARCTNRRDKSYHNYGGRGIRFLYKSFPQFIADIGNKPSPKHSLDRIKVNGHYRVGNCQWSLGSDQQKNKRPVFAIENFSNRVLLQECRRRKLL